MDLIRQIMKAVDRYWAEEVNILGAWEDESAAACVIYCRTIDPEMILGGRFEFSFAAADGTVEGFARDIAVNLSEPIGTAARRQDQHEIVWLGIPKDRPTPQPPDEILEGLTGM